MRPDTERAIRRLERYHVGIPGCLFKGALLYGLGLGGGRHRALVSWLYFAAGRRFIQMTRTNSETQTTPGNGEPRDICASRAAQSSVSGHR